MIERSAIFSSFFMLYFWKLGRGKYILGMGWDGNGGYLDLHGSLFTAVYRGYFIFFLLLV